METKNTGVFYNGLIWGVILGFAGIIYAVILYMAGESLNQALGIAGVIIPLVLLIFGIRNFRDHIRGGVLPFGTAFSFAVIAMIASGVIGAIYSYIQFTLIDPGLLDQVREMTIEKMLNKGVPEEQIEQIMNMGFMKMMQNPVLMTVSNFISGSIIGVIIALIIAAIFKKEDDSIPVDVDEAAE